MLLEETLRRFPDIELAGEPTKARSLFLNQLKTLPVRFTPEAARGLAAALRSPLEARSAASGTGR